MNARTGTLASLTDPATWSSFDAAAQGCSLVGFAFTPDDPYAVIDLDSCRAPDTGTIEPWAMALVERFTTYTEVSQSGTGLHLVGYGALIKPGNRKGKIEVYDHDRYVALTGNVLPGYERIRNIQRELIAWHDEVWPVAPVHPPPEAPSAPPLTLDDQDLIEHLRGEKGGKAAQLLAGDASSYPSPSEARAALAWKCCFYTNDPEQVARVLIAANLFKDGPPERERDRKAKRDAERAVATYDGQRYVPGLGTMGPLQHDAGCPDLDALSCDEVRAQLKAARAENAQLRERVESQAKTIRVERGRREDIERILASTDLQIGPRATAAALYIELTEQRARGRQPTEHGHQIPAVWLARRTGQSADAVGSHLRQLAKQGIITRRVVSVPKGEDYVDLDTGEITTLDVPRKAGFIDMTPEAVVVNLADYRRRTDDPKHGGQQEPKPHCQNHPDAGTITHTFVVCAEPTCGAVVYEGRTEQTPEQIFGPDLAPTGTDDSPLPAGSRPEHGNLPVPYLPVSDSLDRGNLPLPTSPAPLFTMPMTPAEQLRALRVGD